MTHPIEGGLSELISSLEAASEGSRELDALVGLAIRDDYPRTSAEILGDGTIRDGAGPYYAKHFTTSLDAAVALIERKLPGCGITVDREAACNGSVGGGAVINGYIGREGPEGRAWGWIDAKAHTMPLALCVALLKALQDQQVTS